MNGIELTRTLRAQGVTLPIIMVSGHEEVERSALEAGVDLFLKSDELLKIGNPIAAFLHARGVFDRKEMA